MKKLMILTAVALLIGGCKKEKTYCWECVEYTTLQWYDSDPNFKPYGKPIDFPQDWERWQEFCNMTESEIKVWEQSKKDDYIKAGYGNKKQWAIITSSKCRKMK